MIQRAVGGANAGDVNHFLKIVLVVHKGEEGSQKIFPVAFFLPGQSLIYIFWMMGEVLAQRATHFCRQSVAYFSHELSGGKTTKHSTPDVCLRKWVRWKSEKPKSLSVC